MRARLIVAALDSVYGIDLEGQVSSIERGSEGFWGPWQGAGLAAKRIVHAGTVVATIGPDHHVSALVRGGYDTWTPGLDPPTSWRRSMSPARGRSFSPRPSCGLLCPQGDPAHALDRLGGPRRPPRRDPGCGRSRRRRRTVRHSPWHRLRPDAEPVARGMGRMDGARSTAGRRAGAAGDLAAGWRTGRIRARWRRPDSPSLAGRAFRRVACVGGARRVGADVRRHQVSAGRPGAVRRLRRRLRAVPVPARAIQRLERLAGPAWPRQEPGGQASYTDGLEAFAIGMDDEVDHKWCERVGTPWTEWAVLEYEASPLRRYGSSTSLT